MGESADQLRGEIDAKRDDAAAKIDQIEARVYDTAQMARETVDETMVQARETVQQARDTVVESVESVKQSFDLTQQVRERPWPTLGMALGAGFLIGRMLGGEEEQTGARDYRRGDRYAPTHDTGIAAVSYRRQGDEESGLMTGLRDAAKSAGLDTLASSLSGAFIAVLTDRLRGAVEQNFPELANQLRRQAERQGSGGSLWTDTRSSRTNAPGAEPSARPSAYAPTSAGTGMPG